MMDGALRRWLEQLPARTGVIRLRVRSGLARGVAQLMRKGLLREPGAGQPLPSQEQSHPGGDNRPLWAAMLTGLLDPALVLNHDRLVLDGNVALRGLFQCETGQHISQISRAPELLAAVERTFATGVAQSFEMHIPVPVERVLTGQVTPLLSDLASANGPALLVVFRDLTEQGQLARLRADFVANASHELRTPLASLKGFVETLQGAAKDDPVARARFLPIMQGEAERMARLIDDLLSLSRIEMREHVAPQDTIDLVPVVEDVVDMLLPLAKAVPIELSVEVGHGPVLVIGDRDELAQVAQNLIQNAIKYGRKGGRVDVHVRQEAGRIALDVSDDGIGIAPEHLPRLTERFYRVSAKDSRERGGTGLGLAIVKHIVNRHQGMLQIRSTQGVGSTFTVTLPRPRQGQ
ncbi:MAG: ATP-binding protein [Hyphomicrobiaceae bacterium]